MAIYRAVGQNTYKFVTETNFTLSQDLTVPTRGFALPVLKYNNTSASDPGDKYLLFSPTYYTSYNGTVVKISGTTVTNNSSTYYASSYGGRGWISSCVVDGETYYGTKSAYFRAWIDYQNTNRPTYYIKPAKLKMIKYQDSSGTIVTEEYDISSYSYATSYSYTSSGSTYYYHNYIDMYIPKQANDIILAIETIFPEE